MIFVGLSFLLCAGVCAALAGPLFRRTTMAPGDSDPAEGLKATLSRIEADRAVGLIGDPEADEASLEAKRAALSTPRQAASANDMRRLRFIGVGFLAATPLIVAVMYQMTGAPQAVFGAPPPSQGAPPPASDQDIAAMAPPDRRAAIEAMVAGLAARLEQSPEDVEGWRMLARSYAVMNRPQDVIAANQSLLRHSSGTNEDLTNLAAALIAVHGEGGDGEGVLADTLQTLLAREPENLLALYQLGSVERARGAPAQAVALWRRVLERLPPDAPIRPALEAEIAETEAERGELKQ
ncbi:MAG: c-type cytochrome biogenesis protein CcmI [Pseudomonadota bacterium]